MIQEQLLHAMIQEQLLLQQPTTVDHNASTLDNKFAPTNVIRYTRYPLLTSKFHNLSAFYKGKFDIMNTNSSFLRVSILFRSSTPKGATRSSQHQQDLQILHSLQENLL